MNNNYNEFKFLFENRKTNNKTLKEIISGIITQNLTSEDKIKIINTILTTEDKTNEDIDLLFSKFNNIKINQSPLSTYILLNNKKCKFNLSANQIINIIYKTDFSKQDHKQKILAMHILQNNKEQNLNLSPEQIMSVIEKSNMTLKDEYGYTLALHVLTYNKDQNLNLSPNQIMSVMEKSNLLTQNKYKITIPMTILNYNKYCGINLSPNQIMSIIEKSDLSTQNADGWTVPIFLLACNKDENLNLSSEQIISIIKKIDLSTTNDTIINGFFSNLGEQFEMTENQIYEISKIFSKIKEINYENKIKINNILLHHNIQKKLQKEHIPKNTTKI